MLILVSAEITVVSWLRKEEKASLSLLQTLIKTFEFRHHWSHHGDGGEEKDKRLPG